MIIIFLFLVLLVPNCYASPLSIDEVKNYLSKTTQLHDPGDASIGSEPYDYPALDILPLWKKLGIKQKLIGEDSYLFDCKPTAKDCFLPNPEFKVFKRDDIEIMQLTKAIPWDYQYFVFLKGKFVDQLGFIMQKYDEPKVEFLDKDLFAITVLSGSGTEIISYSTGLYQVKDSLKEVLRYESEQERTGWGAVFDEKFRSQKHYSKGVLKLTYDIAVSMNDNEYESKIKGKLTNKPVIKTHKTIVLNRSSEGFNINQSESDFTLDSIERLDWGGHSDYYEVFKNDFNNLAKKDAKTKEWFDIFLGEVTREQQGKKE